MINYLLHSVIGLNIHFTDANIENYSDSVLNSNSVFPIPGLIQCPSMKIIIPFHLMCLLHSSGYAFLSSRLEMIAKPHAGLS